MANKTNEPEMTMYESRRDYAACALGATGAHCAGCPFLTRGDGWECGLDDDEDEEGEEEDLFSTEVLGPYAARERAETGPRTW